MTVQSKQLVKLLRLRHYIKNFFLFLPLFFSGRLREWVSLRACCLGFIAFCFTSSAVYIFNDIRDAESDRRHSTKSLRPIASGAVPARYAWATAAVMLLLSVSAQGLAGRNSRASWVYLAVYLTLNIAYSWRLKQVPILDVSILAAGFLLRLAYGAALSGVAVSGWLFLTVLAMSFYLGLGKRRGELLKQKDTRQVLKTYSREFLDKSMNMCLTLTIAFYSLWAAEGSNLPDGNSSYTGGLLWTVPLAMAICFKYSLDVEGDSDGDPVEVALRDKPLCGLVLLLALMIFALLY